MQSKITITLISVQFGVCCCCCAWFYFSHCFYSRCSEWYRFYVSIHFFHSVRLSPFSQRAEKIKIKCKHYKFYIYFTAWRRKTVATAAWKANNVFVLSSYSLSLNDDFNMEIGGYSFLFSSDFQRLSRIYFIGFYFILPRSKIGRSGLQMLLLRFNRKRHFSNDTHAIRSK